MNEVLHTTPGHDQDGANNGRKYTCNPIRKEPPEHH